MKTTRTAYVKGAAVVAGLSLFALTACSPGSSDEDSSAGDSFTTRDVTDGKTEFVVVTNPGDGPVLSYGKDSGIELLEEEIDGAT
jgi:beta-glucosidase